MASNEYVRLAERHVAAGHAGVTHNAVRVSVDYDRAAGGPVLRLQAVDIDPQPGVGFVLARYAVFASPWVRVVLETGWGRANAKRLTAVRAEARRQLEARSGAAWDALAGFAARHGMALAGADAP